MNIREAVERLKSIPRCQLVTFDIPKNGKVVNQNIYDIIEHLKSIEDTIFEGNLVMVREGHSEEVAEILANHMEELREGEDFLNKYFNDNHSNPTCCGGYYETDEISNLDIAEHFVKSFINRVSAKKIEDLTKSKTKFTVENIMEWTKQELIYSIEHTDTRVNDEPISDELKELMLRVTELCYTPSLYKFTEIVHNETDCNISEEYPVSEDLVNLTIYNPIDILIDVSLEDFLEYKDEDMWNLELVGTDNSIELEDVSFERILDVVSTTLEENIAKNMQIKLNKKG